MRQKFKYKPDFFSSAEIPA